MPMGWGKGSKSNILDFFLDFFLLLIFFDGINFDFDGMEWNLYLNNKYYLGLKCL